MPAIMILRSIDNPVPDSPGKWLAGEITSIVEENFEFGYRQMPLLSIGIQSVSTINSQTRESTPVYTQVTLSDSGTITVGAQGDMDVVAGDHIVWQFNTAGNYWVNYGQRESSDGGAFYHIKITDKAVEEVNLYLEEFNKKLTYESLQYDSGTDQRRWRTNNVRVSASGNNGFNAQGIADITTEWNARDPLTGEEPNPNQITLFDTDNLIYATYDGVMSNEYFDAWKDITRRIGLADLYARRRFYITQAGLGNLAANDGFMIGTAAQVAPFLRDGLLD